MLFKLVYKLVRLADQLVKLVMLVTSSCWYVGDKFMLVTSLCWCHVVALFGYSKPHPHPPLPASSLPPSTRLLWSERGRKFLRRRPCLMATQYKRQSEFS